MKPCIEFLRSRPARRYPSSPADPTLTEILILPHCLGGHLLRSSGPEKLSNQDESHLHETTLAFDSKPALRARSRCREPRQLALLWIIDCATPLGGPHTGGQGFHALRPTSSLDGSKMGGCRERHPDPSPRAHRAICPATSIRPTFSCPVRHPRPLHAWLPSELGRRYAETEVDGIPRDESMVTSRAFPCLPRDQHAR
jgi:hypothetical protein